MNSSETDVEVNPVQVVIEPNALASPQQESENDAVFENDKATDTKISLNLSRIILLETTLPFLAAASISVTVENIISAGTSRFLLLRI